MSQAIYLLSFALLLVGIYAVVAKRNIVKIIMGMLILDYAVNLLLVLLGYRAAGASGSLGAPPILDPSQQPAQMASSAVDPLPQAMVLTSIVIGLGLVALMVAMAVRLYEHYGTFDMNSIRRLRG